MMLRQKKYVDLHIMGDKIIAAGDWEIYIRPPPKAT